MAWYYGNTRIFVQDINDQDVQIISRLHPFSGGTIHHLFGWEETIVKVNAFVVGIEDRDTLRSFNRDGNAYSLDSPWGVWASGYLHQISYKVQQGSCQTLRSDLPEDSPVFVVDMEIYKEEDV